MWQWFRFLVARVPPDKKLLLLNLDETSIRFWYQPRLGLRGRARAKPAGRGAARQASRGQLRKAFTHVAVICDDATLQPQLPQVILVNERTCTNLTLQNWKPIPGCKAEVLRHKSAWINNAKFADILRRIGEALKTHAPDRQAILLMDAHSCHFSEEALAALHAYDIWPCIIPASTTSCLQPLDTHVFARFKMFLRTRLHQAMLSGANKDLDVEEVLDALMHAMRGVLQRNKWSEVFYQNGFGRQFGVRQHLLDILEWTSPPAILAELPCLAQFQSCFPKGRCIPFMSLLSGLLPQRERAAKRVRDTAVAAVAIDEEPIPWSKRLRPRFRGRAVMPKAKAKAAPGGAVHQRQRRAHLNSLFQW